MRDITILVSASGSPSMPGIIDCFKKNGERRIRIVGVDMSEEPSAKYLVDVFYKVPAATKNNYVDIILEICEKENVDIYFPNISTEVTAVSKRKEEFQKIGTIISVSKQSSVEIANNKLSLYKFLQNKGISVPKFYGVHSVEEFEMGCAYLGYPESPVCLKIVDGSGSRGVRIIDSKRNRYQIFVNEKPNSFFVTYEDMISILKEADNEFHEMLLVEYLPGNEYTVDLLAQKGEVKYMVGRENIVSLMSIAQESEVKKDIEAYEMCKKVVKALELDGNIGFDFMRDTEGKAILMDLNPRITATVSVISAAGVNLPYLRVKQLLGEKLPKVQINYGTKLKRRYGEIYTDINGYRIYIDKMKYMKEE
jgi:carbamoylphosphate synthase large subunit